MLEHEHKDVINIHVGIEVLIRIISINTSVILVFVVLAVGHHESVCLSVFSRFWKHSVLVCECWGTGARWREETLDVVSEGGFACLITGSADVGKGWRVALISPAVPTAHCSRADLGQRALAPLFKQFVH